MFQRGDVYFAQLGDVAGSEQGGIRPVVIIQNNIGNKFSPTVVCASITSQQGKKNLPTHVKILAGEGGLSKESVIMTEQLRTLDKSRLIYKIGKLDNKYMMKINFALNVSLELSTFNTENNEGVYTKNVDEQSDLLLSKLA